MYNQVIVRTSSIYGHFIIWPSSVTLTFNLPNEELCQIIFKSMHKCTNYSLDKLSLWPFSHLTFKSDLDLQPTWTNFQIELLLLKDNNYAKLFWNPWINVQLMAWTSSVYDHIIIYLQPTWTMVSNRISTPQGQQLCQITLKSMHKCTSYGLHKLNLWPFYHLTFKCDLDLQFYLNKCFKQHFYSSRTTTAKLFWNFYVMARTKPHGWTHAQGTNAKRIHIHLTEIVRTTSRSQQVGLANIDNSACPISIKKVMNLYTDWMTLRCMGISQYSHHSFTMGNNSCLLIKLALKHFFLEFRGLNSKEFFFL